MAQALLRSAVVKSLSDLQVANKQEDLARRVMLKFNVRLDYSVKRFICHGCKKLIVPGVNARVRLAGGRPKMLRITCLDCGYVNRKVLSRRSPPPIHGTRGSPRASGPSNLKYSEPRD